MFVKDLRLGSRTETILWIGLTALSAINTLSGAMRIHKVVRALVTDSR
jgi:hypothetical protein